MTFPDVDLDVTVLAHLGADRTDVPGDWPAATDLSSRLLDPPILITRGRGPGQQSAQSAQCTLWLNNGAIGDGLGANAAGALTPLLATSSYFPDWDLGVPISVAVGSDTRFCGFAADIATKMIQGAGGETVSAVRVVLGGLLRQLTQGAEALSPLSRHARAFLGTDYATNPSALRGWWSLESGDGTITSTPSGVPGGQPATVIAPAGEPAFATFADGLAGASGALDLSGGASLRGPLQHGTLAGLWGFECGVRISSQTAGGRIALVGQDGGLYLTLVTTGTNAISVVLAGGGLSNTLTGTATIADGEYHWVSITVTAAAFGTDPAVVTLRVDGVAVTLTGAVTVISAEPAEFIILNVDEATQIFHWRYLDSLGTADAAIAHAGEQAHVRIERLCDQNSIPFATSASSSSLLGPQGTDTLVALLVEAETADRGVLAERIDTWGLSYLSSTERYNLTAALTVDLATYNITGSDASGTVLAPVRNDARTRNQWTVSTVDGQSATHSDSAHIARRGLYSDSATVNVETVADALHDAGWRVREGTFDGLRYVGLPVDLAANPGLITDWLALNMGDRVDRTGHPDIHPAGTVSVVLEGYTERLAARAWNAMLNIEPYPPWHVNVLAEANPDDDDPYVGWAEYDTCVLASGVDDNDTSWSITCTPADSSNVDDFPRDHLIGGELVTVTASTGGTSPTWTVTRSANGVAKTHSAGAEIELADPVIPTLS